jgi:nucleotide-binding universal stress UspA family protein
MLTILVAVDGSPRAPGVFRAGTDLARATRAHVALFRAVSVPPDFAPAAATDRVDPLPAFLDQQARTELLALMEQIPDVSCEVRIERIEDGSPPWRAILAAAAKVDADLVVLGSHGYRGWDRVLGTTAAQVANRARRNVLVVHERGVHGAPDTDDTQDA